MGCNLANSHTKSQCTIKYFHMLYIWASTVYFGTYHTDKQQTLRGACAYTGSSELSLLIYTMDMKVEEGLDKI